MDARGRAHYALPVHGVAPLLLTLMASVPATDIALPDDPLGPVSVNGTSLSTVSSGTLVGGGYLERSGAHHTSLPAHRRRDNRYGTVELVSVIRHAAARVAAEFPGSKLHVGNLSQRGGGDLTVSVSHNSGRDADLAFFVVGDPRARPTNFVRFDAQGRSRKASGRWRFDVPRNWALVKALIQTDGVPGDTQFLFISRGLKQLLMEHARRRGEDPEILRRADKILKQPTGSLPHDDHLHLRLYCPADDLLDGCRNYGPTWDWVDDHALLLRRRSLAVAAVLDDDDASVARKHDAMDLLEAIRGVDAAPWLIAQAGPDRPAELRLRALQVLGAIRPQHGAHRLARMALEAPDPQTAAATLDVLAALGDARVWPFVAGLLTDRREVDALPELEPRAPASRKLRHEGRRRGQETLGVRASRTLAALDAVDAVPLLIETLADKDPALRVWTVKALRRITNAQPERTRWGGRSRSAKRRGAGILAWRTWWDTHRGQHRDAWLARGFEAADPPLSPNVELVSDSAAPRLIKILRSRRRHLAHNARVVLRRIAKLRPWRQGDPYIGQGWWLRWWRTHRRRQRRGIGGGADVGVRGILRHTEPVPVRTRTL